MIFNQAIRSRTHGNFIGQAPNYNAWMIIVLRYQFSHLRNGIVISGIHVFGNIRNFRPDNQPVFITKIIKILVMLIMGQTNGCGPNFLNQLHVFPVMFRQQCITNALAVLVPGYTVQRIWLSVQIKAIILRNFKRAATKPGGYSVNYAMRGTHQVCRSSVKVWIFTAVPQVYLWNADFCGSYVVFRGGFCCSDSVPFCVRNRKYYFAAVLRRCNICFQFYLGIGALNNRSNLDSGSTVIIQIKVGMVYADGVHIPINTAIEGKVCRLRIHPVIRRIVYSHYKYVVIFQEIGDISSPGGIATIMLRHLLAIHVQGGAGVGSAEFQVNLLAFRQIRPVHFFSVITGATVIVVSAVLPVYRVPGVRQGDGF